LAVQFADDFWPPMFGEGAEFFFEIHLFHPAHSSTAADGLFVLQSRSTLR
jgi:hypothetical protein